MPEGWWAGLGSCQESKKRHIYIFAVLPHLESTPLGWIEHQEALEEVLAVGGHVEGDSVLPSEDALPQLLPATGETGELVSQNPGTTSLSLNDFVRSP